MPYPGDYWVVINNLKDAKQKGSLYLLFSRKCGKERDIGVKEENSLSSPISPIKPRG